MKQNTNSNLKDGMEVGLIVIDESTNSIKYAGANINLHVFCKNEIISYAGAKCSVGSEQEKVFNLPVDVSLTLSNGDKLFMHTDGITDQFGGAKNKELGSKKLKEILLKHHQNNLSEFFKNIKSELLTYKGNTEQTDDMLFLTIEI